MLCVADPHCGGSKKHYITKLEFVYKSSNTLELGQASL